MELTRVAQGTPNPVVVQRGPEPKRAAFDGALNTAAAPRGTPLEQEIDAAWRRGAELQAQGRELHFQRDEQSGRVVIEVRDPTGQLVRRIPATETLSILAGKQPG